MGPLIRPISELLSVGHLLLRVAYFFGLSVMSAD